MEHSASAFLAALMNSTSFATVKLLFRNDSDLAARDADGNTALHWAASNGDGETVKFLIDKGADRQSRNNMNATPFHEAINRRRPTVILKLLYEEAIGLKQVYEDGNNVLHLAAPLGDSHLMRFFIENGADRTALNDRNHTPFQEAVISLRPLNILELLYVDGVDLRAKYEDGNTVLHLAAADGDSYLLQFFIKNGADRTAVNDRNHTPFQTAVINRRPLNLLQLLHVDGVDLRAKYEDGNTVLHLAASDGDDRWVKFLLELGADRHAFNNRGNTAFHEAIQRRRPGNILELLYDDAMASTSDDETANGLLRFAALQGNADALKFLAGRGVAPGGKVSDDRNSTNNLVRELLQEMNLTNKDGNGNTPLHLAASHGEQYVVELLLQNGADRQAVNDKRLTPFHLAVAEKRPLNVLMLLYDGGIDLTTRYDNDTTILQMAALDGNADALKFLIEKGGGPADRPANTSPPLTDLTARDQQGNTLLHLAAANGDQDVIQLLLQQGADRRVVNARNNTAFHVAIDRRRPSAVLKLLYDQRIGLSTRYDGGDSVLHIAARVGSVDIVQFFVENGADRKALNDKTLAPFHEAISHGRHLNIAKLLYYDGVDLTAASEPGGNSALHFAAEGGAEDVIEFLLSKGADRMAVANQTMTAFHHAVASRRDLKVLKLLYQEGIDVAAKLVDDGRTLLHVAALYDSGTEDVIEFLIEKGADRKAMTVAKLVPFHVAIVIRRDPKIVKLLYYDGAETARDPNGNTPLHLAAINAYEKGLEGKLNELGILTDGHAVQDGTPISIYLSHQVKLIFNNSIDVNSKDQYGMSAISSTAWYGKEEVVQFLLDRGADPKAVNDRGWTAFMLAVAESEITTVRLLYRSSSDLTDTDQFGNSVLVLAAYRSRGEQVLQFVKERMGITHFDIRVFSETVDVLRYLSVALLAVTLAVYIVLPEIRNVPGYIIICYIVTLAGRLSLAPLMINMFDEQNGNYIETFIDLLSIANDQPASKINLTEQFVGDDPLCISLGDHTDDIIACQWSKQYNSLVKNLVSRSWSLLGNVRIVHVAERHQFRHVAHHQVSPSRVLFISAIRKLM